MLPTSTNLPDPSSPVPPAEAPGRGNAAGSGTSHVPAAGGNLAPHEPIPRSGSAAAILRDGSGNGGDSETEGLERSVSRPVPGGSGLTSLAPLSSEVRP